MSADELLIWLGQHNGNCCVVTDRGRYRVFISIDTQDGRFSAEEVVDRCEPMLAVERIKLRLKDQIKQIDDRISAKITDSKSVQKRKAAQSRAHPTPEVKP